MTASVNLSLPTDIPWKKVCLTDDMMDRVVCDVELPPKWQSSVAVFKYIPEDEYQIFPDYKITYLKVTSTITGYQPLDDEIQGEIDWDSVNVETIDGLTDLLNSYHPCTGAILQVIVGPPGKDPRVPFEKYPFFLDFEPKKRELYELATDTREKQSRSIETLNISKSAGTTQSLEVMDIDMGGGGFGIKGEYSDIGGGINIQESKGQWGTKRLNTDQSQVNRTTESGTEKKESYSHTTQLSQMYHLLDSYHLGTNRVVFFIQPRPHVLEEPSGFVRGPRKVEGIQEFFLVVAQPESMKEEFCVSLRLDTSHLVETDILEYDYKEDTSLLATATAPVPTENDTFYDTITGEACFVACWDVTYRCYYTRAVDDKVYEAPDGYIISDYTDIVNDSSTYGNSSISLTPDRKVLTVHAEANSYRCFHHSGTCVNCDPTETLHGYARRQVQVTLRSEEPIVKVGTRQHLLITTRGLCCCPGEDVEPGVRVQGWWDIPKHFGGLFYYDPQFVGRERRQALKGLVEAGFTHKGLMQHKATDKPEDSSDCNCQGGTNSTSDGYFERRISIRQANGMIDFIREQMIKSFREPRPGYEPKRFIETDYFHRQLETLVRRSPVGYEKIRKKARRTVPEKVLASVSKHFGIPPKAVKVSDVLRIKSHEYLRLMKMKPKDVYRMKMGLLGVKVKERKVKSNKKTQRGGKK